VAPELAVTVYHMDIRAMGKGYERYMAGVQGLEGVRYRRSMPSKVYERPGSGRLVVGYVGEDGRVGEEEHDLLVLAVGLGPAGGVAELAGKLGVEVDENGFVRGEGYQATRTGREGVYVAGAGREPKDIPDTVVEAVAAAGEVAAYLQGGLGREEERKGVPVRDVSEEEARVGVYVCACGGELGALEPEGVAEWARGQPGVVVARAVGEACSGEGLAGIAEEIEVEGLNRLVIAGCSQRWYRSEFEGMMAGVGLDSRLLARVNVRDEVQNPHEGGNGRGLRGKAESLVGMAVAKQRTMSGLAALVEEREGERREKRALVVGGGAAGMSAALGLARLGIGVDLVERERELGGQWRSIRYQVDGSDVAGALAAKVEEVGREAGIRVHLGAEVVGVEGGPGQYRTRVRGEEGEEEIGHSVVVLATGSRAVETEEYLYGRDPRVVTQRELEEQVAEGTLARVRRVVMVQCVGSREEGRPWCSRVCCTQAIKNALRLKEARPGVEVYVLYREVRTYGLREEWYERARQAGVVFVRYGKESKPEVESRARGLVVRVRDEVLGQGLEVAADLVVLSVGMEGETGEMGEEYGVGVDEEGWYREEHGKMKPLDVRGGVYIAGVSQGPGFVEEAILGGQGAAMRAAAWLAGRGGAREGSRVRVSGRLCSYCGLCVEACPYGARVLDEGERVAVVDVGLCAGCGVCAVVCPNKATLQIGYEQRQMMAALDMALI
jgi:heterodisulfide reductase subunit A